jgi:hypothetical protein
MNHICVHLEQGSTIFGLDFGVVHKSCNLFLSFYFTATCTIIMLTCDSSMFRFSINILYLSNDGFSLCPLHNKLNQFYLSKPQLLVK